MAYDEGLAERIRHLLADEPGVTERKMFGGLAFLVDGNMAVAANNEGDLMFRADPATANELLSDHVRPQTMGERVMSGWLHVDAEVLATDGPLGEVVARGVTYARTLPPK